MSKLKNIFKLSVLSVASLALLGSGAGLVLSQNSQSSSVSYADTNATVNNTQHDFFIGKWKDKDNAEKSTLTDTTSPLVLANDGDYINLKFDVTSLGTEPESGGTEAKNLGFVRYDTSDEAKNTWDCFTFTNFSVKRNGSPLSFGTDKGNPPPYVKKQEAGTVYGSPVGRGTMDFNLDITFKETDVSSPTLSENKLQLTEEGVYEISIPYTMYSTVDNGNSFPVSSSGTIVWTFMLFSHDTYLVSGLNTPSINIQNFGSIEENDLFFNYQGEGVPYFDYDVTRYNLTITKSLNNEDSSVSLVYNHDENKTLDFKGDIQYKDGNIVYNDAFYNKYCDTGLFELSFDKESKTARVYLKDIGKYTLDFDLVYSYNTDNLNPTTYILPKDVDGKRAYLYGYQSTFTKYNTSASKNEYPEFKTYDSNFNIKESADITRLANITGFPTSTSVTIPSTVIPVSTNQSPVKFKEYGTYNNAYLYKVTETTNAETDKTTLTLDTGTQITSTKNVSLSGNETEQKYLAVFEYSFDDYIKSGLSAPSHKFYQAFYFELTNATPTVTVKAGDYNEETSELPSQDFTNQTVYIKNNYAASTFNSDPIIEIVRYDFMTRTYDTARDLSSYEMEGNDYYKITEDGRYTINIYSGRNGKAGTPITRQFTIDTTDIENVEAYGVSLKNSSEYIVTTSNLEGLTNQPLIFTWKDRKESGARTFGYYKYYSLEADTSASYESALSFFLINNDSMPINYILNLSSSPSMIRYSNAEEFINSDSISPSYVKTGAGLYILFIEDQAGNKATSVYLLDNTTSPFAIKKTEQGTNTYSFLNQNETLSQDATIYWAGNKVFKVTGTPTIETGYSEEVINSFKTNYIKTINSVPEKYQGTYISIPFTKQNDSTKVLFKDLGSNSTNFVSFEGNRYDIISSFSLYTYTNPNDTSDVSYYLSSTSGIYYITSDKDLRAYKNNEISSYELYVRAQNLSKDLGPFDSSNANFYENVLPNLKDYSGDQYDAVYTREGSFDFMIRDGANTKGANLTEDQQYLNYPTGYQVINLSSDKSEMKVVYKDSGNNIPLTSADYASQEGKIDETGLTVASNKQKTAYYYPTSINQKLYLSFVPKIENGDELIQIESIHVEFYPFVKKFSSKVSIDVDGKLPTLNYYRDLSKTPTINMDISFDETATTVQTYELNIVQEKTQEGKYIITRTYKYGEVEGVTYTIDKYDFMKRTIEFIVERENVISEPEVISATTKTYTYETEEITLSTIGSVLISSTSLKGSYSVKVGDQSTNDMSETTDDKGNFYYVFDDVIEDFDLQSSFDETITKPTPTTSIEQSAQSIVGSGIMVSVFSGTTSSVEFPNNKLTNEGYAKYNSGYTFYTVAQSYSDILNTSLNSVFTTNKRPFKIYIPSYKYTTHTITNETDTDPIIRSFKSFNNENLVKFNDDNFIDYYQLSAEIYKDNEKYAVSSDVENGFLKFSKINGEELTNFTEVGRYYVVVTQAINSRANDVNSFKNNYAFSFTVAPGEPDFTLYDGKGYELDGPRDEYKQLTDTLYTNQKTIMARWTDDLSEFITDIDVKKIKIVLGGEEYSVEVDKQTGEITVKNDSVDGDKLKNIQDSLSFTYYSSSLLNELKIDLEKAGCYKHGEEVSITLEYENPTNIAGIYSPKTKTIIVDTSIFDEDGSTTIDSLFEKLKNFYPEMELNNLRTYFDSDGNKTTEKSKTCYSQTSASGFYRYYSYLASQTFFDELLTSIENNKLNNENGKTSVYFRSLDSIYKADDSFEETNYDSFFTSSPNFKNLELNFEGITSGYYYEIVERDYAGNLNIYLVYFYKNEEEALGYTTESSATPTIISDEIIMTDKFNVYSKTDLKISEVLFHGDNWNFVKVEQSGKTNLYVKAPWLTDGYIQNLTTGKSVEISTLLDESNSINKSIVSISDRSNGEWKRVYVSKSNISSLNLENVSSDQEGIKIKLPAGDVLTSGAIIGYPVSIKLEVSLSGASTYYTFTNNPLENVDKILQSESYQSNWTSNSNPLLTFEYSDVTNYLTLYFNISPTVGTKVKYTVTDNFGNETSTIHIFGTDFTDSYEYTGYLYQAYDEDGHLINYVQNSYTYQYNSGVYDIKVYLDEKEITSDKYSENYISMTPGAKYNSLKFEKSSTLQLDRCYEIKVCDADTKDYIKSIYINIYDVLPRLAKDGETYDYVVNFFDQNGLTINDKFTGDYGTVTLDGRLYSYEGAKTFATLVNIQFTTSSVKIPYGAYIYKEGDSDFSIIESGYQIREAGIYYVLFKHTSDSLFTHEYKLYKLEILDSSTNFFYVTLDGKVVNSQNTYFTYKDKQYSNYYLVNVAYSEKSRVNIETNTYQKVTYSITSTITEQGVTTVIYTLTNKTESGYPVGVSPYYDQIAISYIPNTSSPSQRFSYVSPSGEEVSILNESSAIVTAEKGTSFNQLILKWSNYFGLSENKIYLKIEKDDREIETATYYENVNKICYTILDTSGLYKISIWDYAGNRQKFGTKDYFELIFLKDAHITMTHVENGEEIKTEMIDKGVFNGPVKITLENIRKFYLSSSVNRLTAKRNGSNYNIGNNNSATSTYTFTEVGFYQIYVSATAVNGVDVREQVYSFTIINPNEMRYAFNYSAFESYIVSKVIKDDGVLAPIEKSELENADSIYVSYYDANTGLGVWTVTIDTGKKLNISSDTSNTTKFTFSFLIRSAVPPIRISEPEGSTSTKTITVSFNAENIYNAVGDCILKIGSTEYKINADTIASIGTKHEPIDTAGTYFIQVTTESGNLLYSYMVTKKDPLNTWAIIAIVLGSVVAIAVVIIIFKLRKRIKVK